MIQGNFCFLSEEYYIDFPDEKLMKNKEIINGIEHHRPCFFAFNDAKNKDILWLIPVSSKHEKYKAIYDKKVAKYGKCNTLVFGKLIETQAVFLIQNMCPSTKKYIKKIYVDKNNMPIGADDRLLVNVITNAKEVLAKYRHGANIIFPNVDIIEKKLIEQIEVERVMSNPGIENKDVHFNPHALTDKLQQAKQKSDDINKNREIRQKGKPFEREI